MLTLRRVLVLLTLLGLLGADLQAQQEAAQADAAAAEQTADEELADKLLPLTQMETAFKKALVTRRRLEQFIKLKQQELENAETEEEKKQIRKDIGSARKTLQTIRLAMEVIFGVGGRRVYSYDEVNSTIYLRVGTVEEVFIRAIRARDLYAQYIQEQKKALEEAEDAEKKDEIQKKIDTAARRYQLIADALYRIYGVSTKRDYSYNPKNSTLYMKVSDAELEKLRDEVEKLKAERDAEQAEADAEQE